MSNLVQATAISQYFQDGQDQHQVLNHIDFEINWHDKVAIVGSSGSGKTTLLHILSGLARPSSGEILLAGESLQAMTDREMESFRAKHLGFMFQKQHFIPELNMLQNVALPLALRGDRDAEDKAILILDSLKLPSKLFHMFPNQLSGGEQSRVGLARALVHGPSLLVADEPSASLDHALTEEIFLTISEMQEVHQFAMLIATHDHSLLKYIDCVYQLRDGQLKECKDV